VLITPFNPPQLARSNDLIGREMLRVTGLGYGGALVSAQDWIRPPADPPHAEREGLVGKYDFLKSLGCRESFCNREYKMFDVI